MFIYLLTVMESCPLGIVNSLAFPVCHMYRQFPTVSGKQEQILAVIKEQAFPEIQIGNSLYLLQSIPGVNQMPSVPMLSSLHLIIVLQSGKQSQFLFQKEINLQRG